jgi:hypothetical protein
MHDALPLRSVTTNIGDDPSVISRDDVIIAFKLILGRAPESDAVIAAHQLSTLSDLRLVLLRSKEFAEKYKAIRDKIAGEPKLSA